MPIFLHRYIRYIRDISQLCCDTYPQIQMEMCFSKKSKNSRRKYLVTWLWLVAHSSPAISALHFTCNLTSFSFHVDILTIWFHVHGMWICHTWFHFTSKFKHKFISPENYAFHVQCTCTFCTDLADPPRKGLSRSKKVKIKHWSLQPWVETRFKVMYREIAENTDFDVYTSLKKLTPHCLRKERKVDTTWLLVLDCSPRAYHGLPNLFEKTQ